MGKTVSENGINLIKKWEGLYLKSYYDCVGVITIGWGITNADKSITGTSIHKGMTISRETAEKWLRDSLNKKYLPKVLKYDGKYDFNQNQLDALVSFAYNIGSIDQLTANGTRSITTIAKKILEYNKAGGRYVRGLAERRRDEYNLFVKPCSKASTPKSTPSTSVKKNYTGTYPVLPDRGYYKEGDGIITLTDYPTQIKRVQKLVNWVLSIDLATDGKYGKKTADAVEKLQEKFKLPVNGCFGEKCLEKCKAYKK